MTLHTISAPVVMLNVYYHSGPASEVESRASIVIARRDCRDQIIRLIEDLDCRDGRARLHTQNGSIRAIAHCSWDDLVLDPTAASLLRDDFEAFWERESWFREKRIPYRRGYLLHGPPGNGKTTAVRAMMCSKGLSAFTMRLFDERTSDGDLDDLFDAAQKERPAMVLLEDLDRAFPRTGESPTNVSLQYLLNCLDGVATGEGIVVVATANQPFLLDPAILRRPGRFDRVVNFPNPTATLRDAYFHHMNPDFNGDRLSQPITESEGFSFAQLREAYVLAAQAAFERSDDIRADDLLSGIRTLRQSVMLGSSRTNEAGFRPDSNVE
jgi:SpoVK/Ycf46/Vps4 family AAA+-type ATPase